MSISVLPIESEKYFTQIFSFQQQGSPESYAVTANFKFLSSSVFTTSSGGQTPMAIEPFFSEPFFGGDFDAIIGNAQRARSSNLFFDVDYTSNIITPVNQDSLIDSTQKWYSFSPICSSSGFQLFFS